MALLLKQHAAQHQAACWLLLPLLLCRQAGLLLQLPP
jgi:hypothetical protein